MDGLPFLEYLEAFRDDLIFNTQQHAILTIYVLVIAAFVGLLIAVLTYRSSLAAQLAISSSSLAFTLPSIALFGLLVPIFGLGLGSALPVLVLYALLPIVRNAIVGLQSVDPNMIDAARGMGMSRTSILLRVEMPLAWPVVLTGVRVAGQLTMGLIVIAAYIGGPGLGELVFHALSNLGSTNTFNEALAGSLLVVVLALLLDAIFVLIRRFTTPRGLRV